MKTISLVSSCYNEELNLKPLVEEVFSITAKFPQYNWEYIIIDNCSTDNSANVLRDLAALDKRIKVILNTRNFGYIRSPFHAILQSRGDAAIALASDLQDPPELIPKFIEAWESGYKVVAGIKNESEEAALFFLARKFYYNILTKLSETVLLKNFTGFGLYDKVIVDHLRDLNDPYPYFRGLISELGFPVAKIQFKQPLRKRGFSKSNFLNLYDVAMLGLTSHTKIPLRLSTMLGFTLSIFSLTTSFVYLILKLILWNSFVMGQAPRVIGMFFIGSVQLMFIGVLGEYIGAIHTKVSALPLVIESERINF
jgi:glycosyltransferase involved in cell wall biosynthesis